jgi:hypothetical protein
MTVPDRAPTAQEILDCLERLDGLLASRPSFFARGRGAARDREARRLLRQLREALAGDGRQATALRAEAEAVLCRAQDEARRLVEEAAELARRTREEGALPRTPDAELQSLREQAIREADETRRGADAYALNVLERLEQEVARILATVQRGKMILGERGGARATPPARLDNGKMASV